MDRFLLQLCLNSGEDIYSDSTIERDNIIQIRYMSELRRRNLHKYNNRIVIRSNSFDILNKKISKGVTCFVCRRC